MASQYIVIFTGWRALASVYQLLKLDSLFFSVPVLLFSRVANNHIVVAENATNHALELIHFDFNAH